MTTPTFPNGQSLTGEHDTYQLVVPLAGWKNIYHATALSTRDHMLLKSRRLLPVNTLRVARENYAAEKLSPGHPNLVLPIDYCASDGLEWIVYPYINGEDMHQFLLREKTMTPKEGKIVVDGICDGLSYVHVAGIIHRDVKPENILLIGGHSPSREFTAVKLCDFDLMYHADLAHTEVPDAAIGTPHFIAPEVWQGHGACTASDIYSFGVTVFETLTGRTPFRGDMITLPIKHLADPPPRPDAIDPLIPRSIADVVLHALEKDPKKRFSCADEFKEEYAKALKRE